MASSELKYIMVAVALCLLVGIAILVALVIGSGIFSAAKPSSGSICPSGMDDGPNGTCCSYVCNAACPSGYKPNTCRCECLNAGNSAVENAPVPSAVNSTPKTVENLGNVFDEPAENFSMPPLPN